MELKRTPRQILVIRTDRLGETLLNLPLLTTLKEAFPDATITWMVNAELKDLLRDAPGVDWIIGYREDPNVTWWVRAIRLARSLRAQAFDLAVVSNPKKEFHVATWFAGIPHRLGYDRKWGWLLTHRIADRKALGDHHEVEYNLELLKRLGILIPPLVSFRLPVGPEDERDITKLLEGLSVKNTGRVVAVHPWSSNPRKQWLPKQFQSLIQRLGQVPEVTAVLIGGTHEQGQSQHVIGDRHDAGVLDLVGRLSLRQLAALLRKARVLVSNDSGPMHLATAVGTPVVALFGTEEPGSHPRRWGPWGSGHTVIHKPLRDITVDEVFQAIQRYLS